MNPGKHQVRSKKLPVVIYKRLGKELVRSRPTVVRLTEGTIRSASNFGRASAAASAIRRNINAMLPNPTDRSMQYRLNQKISRWINLLAFPGELGRLKDEFSFNSKSRFLSRFKVDIKIDWRPGEAILKIPAFDPLVQISRPSGANAVNIHVKLLNLCTNRPFIVYSEEAAFQFSLNDGMQVERELSFPLKNGEDILHLMLMAFTPLEFHGAGLEPVSHPRWLPVDVIDVRGGSDGNALAS